MYIEKPLKSWEENDVITRLDKYKVEMEKKNVPHSL